MIYETSIDIPVKEEEMIVTLLWMDKSITDAPGAILSTKHWCSVRENTVSISEYARSKRLTREFSLFYSRIVIVHKCDHSSRFLGLIICNTHLWIPRLKNAKLAWNIYSNHLLVKLEALIVRALFSWMYSTAPKLALFSTKKKRRWIVWWRLRLFSSLTNERLTVKHWRINAHTVTLLDKYGSSFRRPVT